jgi:ankyrin repeat protein
MVRKLTSASSLESLKKEAKRWLKALRAGDAAEHARFETVHPRPPADPSLREVQHALAREHGFSGWSELRHAVEGIAGAEREATPPPIAHRPEALGSNEPWPWSTGAGTDVWEMFVASSTGDVQAVERLLDRDPSLVRAHYEYRTPLSFAVRENQVEVVELLLARGADPIALGNVLEVASERGYKEMVALLEVKVHTIHGASERGEPVAAAIRAQDRGEVQRLLDENPTLVHAGDRRSSQPIHWAVMTRQLDMIDEVLARGAHIDAPRQDGARPIHLTNGDYHYRGWRDVPSGRPKPDEVYRHLVTRGATVDIWMASAKGDVARVRTVLAVDSGLANRVSPYGSYYIGCGSALRNAAAGGHREIVELLLEQGADPNLPEEGIAPYGHALYDAVYNGHYEIAELLLEHGAHPNQPVESSADTVWIAIRNKDERMLRLLARHGARWEIPFGRGGLSYRRVVATGIERTLTVLAAYADVEAARELLAEQPHLADDPEALQEAAQRGHLDFVRLMLDHRPDLARRVSVSKPRRAAILLFERGMDPNRTNWVGTAPLHRFAAEGDVASARLFLDHGADLEARDHELRSRPLAYAARRGRLRMVRFLLGRGATTEHPDDPPWATPLAWAKRGGHADVVRLLEKRGARSS